MTAATAETATSPQSVSWIEANQRFLNLELRRLRLLLRRRVLWLRNQWKHDPLQAYQGLVISDSQADWLLRGEDGEVEARFYEQDTQSVSIAQAIRTTDLALSEQRKVWNEAKALPALEMLARLFGLTSFERNVLLLCYAPIDPPFERLYAYVQDDVTRKYATPHLALTLLATQSSVAAKQGGIEQMFAAHNAFLPDAPLRRFRLVNLDSAPSPSATLTARPLRLDDRIADYIRGVNRLDERLADLLRPAFPDLLAPSHQDLLARLVHLLESQKPRSSHPLLNFVGPRGCGKQALARALADRVGVRLYQLDAKGLPISATERHDLLHLLEREMVLLGSALYLDAADVGADDKVARDSLSKTVERLQCFLLIGSQERWPSERAMEVVQVPKPDASAQRTLWQAALKDVPHSINGEIDSLVQQFDLGPNAISQVVQIARSRKRLLPPTSGGDLTADDLWQVCRERAAHHLDDLIQRITPCFGWEHIVLPEDVFRQLQELASQVAHCFHVYQTLGFGKRLSRGRGISALFSGPSGTGKTMAAEVLANHLKLDLYRIDLAGVVNKYIGETEKNLRKVFDAAQQSGAILFFDECDALFGKRFEERHSQDRFANIQIDYLLQLMEEYRGLAILATNRRTALDRAFLRRLRFLVDFPTPDAANRRKIWERVFPQEAAVDRLDFDALSRLEIPGGNIKNIALNAAFIAASDNAPIHMSHIMRAARREYAKIDKLITSTEFISYPERMKS